VSDLIREVVAFRDNPRMRFIRQLAVGWKFRDGTRRIQNRIKALRKDRLGLLADLVVVLTRLCQGVTAGDQEADVLDNAAAVVNGSLFRVLSLPQELEDKDTGTWHGVKHQL